MRARERLLLRRFLNAEDRRFSFRGSHEGVEPIAELADRNPEIRPQPPKQEVD